ncbi:alanine racemase [beta proteobacterium MWH-UniP1]
MPRPIRLTVHIDAMRHNLSCIRQRVGQSRIWAVAKANAYGQGIAQAVRAFASADGLAVLDLSEAQAARESGWAKPILMIEGAFSAEDLSVMAQLDLTTVISTPEQAQCFIQASQTPSSAWVKLNTGMNRLGLNPQLSDTEIADLLLPIQQKLRQPLGWMTHFANADTDDGWQAQLSCFQGWQPRLARAIGGAVGPVSLANSAASLSIPQAYADWVRPGIALYGATPWADGVAAHTAAGLGLRPVQQLTSEIIAIQQVKRGEAVGYGARFVADRDRRIGVVAVGYADGYPRLAPDGTPVWVAGRIVPLAGRVSMDMITVDLTDHPGAVVGSPCELWGEHVAIDDVANRSGTIGYELMTKITARVPRMVVE